MRQPPRDQSRNLTKRSTKTALPAASGCDVGQHGQVEAEDRAVGLLEREPDRHAAAGGRDLRAERAHREHGGTEGRVEHRRDLGSDEGESVESVHGRESGIGSRESGVGSRHFAGDRGSTIPSAFAVASSGVWHDTPSLEP